MEYSWKQDGDIVRVRFTGSLTNAVLDQQHDCLTEKIGSELYRQPLVFDLSGVDYLDSCTVGWILKRHRNCKEQGGKLVLLSPQPLVRNLLSILKIEKVISIVDDEKKIAELCSATGGGVV